MQRRRIHEPRRAISVIPRAIPAPGPNAGAGLNGAPPTENGPTGWGSREGFLCDILTTRARVGCATAEVTTGIAPFCRASIRATSEES